jgi:hypothetical protein
MLRLRYNTADTEKGRVVSKDFRSLDRHHTIRWSEKVRQPGLETCPQNASFATRRKPSQAMRFLFSLFSLFSYSGKHERLTVGSGNRMEGREGSPLATNA